MKDQPSHTRTRSNALAYFRLFICLALFFIGIAAFPPIIVWGEEEQPGASSGSPQSGSNLYIITQSTRSANEITALPATIYWYQGSFYATMNTDPEISFTDALLDTGGNAYTKLSDVVSAITGDTTIHICSKYTANTNETIAPGYDLTLVRSMEARMIEISNGATLTLQPSGSNKLIIKEGDHSVTVVTAIEVVGALKIYKGTSIEGFNITSNGGALFVNGGTVHMYGGQFINNSAQNGGAIYVKSGSLSVSGGSIIDNGESGVYNIAASTVFVTGGSIETIPNIAPTNNDGVSLLKYVVQIAEQKEKLVTGIDITKDGVSYPYGCDMYTDSNGYLYLWLPSGCTINSVTIANQAYSPTMETPYATIISYSSAIAGATYYASLENYHGSDPITCQWQRKAAGATDWTNIANAISMHYITVKSDIGYTLRALINAAYPSNEVSILPNTPVFTVTIPETVAMNAGESLEISAIRSGFVTGDVLNVQVSSQNAFQLSNNGDLISYTLSLTPDGSALANNAVIASYNANSYAASPESPITIYYAMPSSAAPKYAGAYTDVLTFTASMTIAE